MCVCVCRASRVLRRVFECVTSSGAWVKRMRREREDMGERRENKRYLHAERERESRVEREREICFEVLACTVERFRRVESFRECIRFGVFYRDRNTVRTSHTSLCSLSF